MKGVFKIDKIKRRMHEFFEIAHVAKDDPKAYSLITDLIAAFCYSTDGIYIVDQDGNTALANPAFEELSGSSLDELIHKNVAELVEQGYFTPSVAHEVLKTGKIQTLIQLNKNGKITLTTGNPIFDEQGNVIRVVSNIRDITELTRLSNELSVKNVLLENHGRILDRTSINANGNIIAESDGMKNILKLASRVALTDSTVLLLGESGVGKGVIAKHIYNESSRLNKPFISLNCSAIPENLLESEIFGYVSGAFTGANRTGKIGLAEAADGGFLFLDEIAELPLSLQPKLLQFLETGEILSVGTTKTKKLNVRVIAATNRILDAMVSSGNFRSDLYYRLNVVPIMIPPLRERKEDIAPLILQRIKKYNEKYKTNRSISHEAFEILVSYSWPGNIRELLNLVERLLVLCENDEIKVSDLPMEIIMDKKELKPDLLEGKASLPVSMPQLVKNLEDTLIQKALDQGGSIRNAAKLLDITASALFRRIQK